MGSFFDQEQWLKWLNEEPSTWSPSQPLLESSRNASLKRCVMTLITAAKETNKHRMRPVGFQINIQCKPIKNYGELRMQEKINESVTCRFCQGSVELVENLRSKTNLVPFWCLSRRVGSLQTKLYNYPWVSDNSSKKIRALIGLKSCFYNSMETQNQLELLT